LTGIYSYDVSSAFDNPDAWVGGAVPGPADNAILVGYATIGTYPGTDSAQTVSGIQTDPHATLNVGYYTSFTATGGTGSGTNAGTIFVKAGGTFYVAGNIANSGLIYVESYIYDDPALLTITGDATLTGGGAVMLGAAIDQIGGASAGVTLTNVDNTISGAGVIGDADLTLINQAGGVIDAAQDLGSDDEVLTLNAAANSSNAGLMETTTGDLTINSTLANTGTVDGYSGGTVTIAGTVANTGLIEATDDGFVVITGAVTGAGSIDLREYATIVVATTGVSASQTVTFLDGEGDVLALAHPTKFAPTIAGFAIGDLIDLQAIPYTSVKSIQWLQGTSQAVQTLQVETSADQTIDLKFAGPYVGQTMVAVSDGEGGTILTLGPSAQDLAAMSVETYSNEDESAVDGFRYEVALSATPDADGFSADVFFNGRFYVIAFRGTVPDLGFTSAFKTLIADASWTTGTPDSYLWGQVNAAATLIHQVAASGLPIILTGHSLGGAVAQILGAETGLPTMAFDAPESGNIFPQLANYPGKGSPFTPLNGQTFVVSGSNNNIRLYGDQISVTGSTGTALPNADIWTVTNPAWAETVDFLPVWETFLQSHDASFIASSLAAGDAITPGISGPQALGPLEAGAFTGTIIHTLGKLFSAGEDGLFSLAFSAVTAQVYPLDPSAATSYALVASAGSPLIASLTLPYAYGVDHYEVETLDNGVWSASREVSPTTAVDFAGGVAGVSFQAFSASGKLLVMPDGFTFGAAFASSGDFTGSLYTQLDARWYAGNANWVASAKWSTGLTPDPTTNVLINAAGTYTVSVTDAESALTVDLADSGATVADSGALTISGALTVSAGSVDVASAGALSVGALAIGSGSVNSAGAFVVSGPVSGAGTLSLSGGQATFGAGAILAVAEVLETGAQTVASFTAPKLTAAKLWVMTAGTASVAAGDRLTFTGAGDSFAGTLAGAGTIEFTGGSDAFSGTTLSASEMTINGAAVTVSGAVVLTSSLSVTSSNLTAASTGVSLSGAGSIILTHAEITGSDAAATLTNVDDKIKGTGELGNGLMTLSNEAAGVISADGAEALIVNTGAATIANAGELTSAGAGGLTIESALDNTGELVVSSGTLTVAAAVSGAGRVRIAAGVADFTAAFGESVTFTGATGVLELAQSQSYAGAITGFSMSGGTSLDLGDIAFVAGATKASYSGTAASGTLTVSDGTATARIKLVGDYLAAAFTVSTDSHGDSIVVAAPEAGPAVHALVGAMAAFGATPGARHLALIEPSRAIDLVSGWERPATA